MWFGSVDLKVVVFNLWLRIEDIVISVELPCFATLGIKATQIAFIVKIDSSICPSISNLAACAKRVIDVPSNEVSIGIKFRLEVTDLSSRVIVVKPVPLFIVSLDKTIMVIKVKSTLKLLSGINFKIICWWCRK